MRGRLRRALVDGLLPLPEDATGAGLLRILQRGSAPARIRALRAAGARSGGLSMVLLSALLRDPVPGVRRAAAWSLGRQGAEPELRALWEAARVERCDSVRLAMVVAAVRLGAEVPRAWALLEQAAARRFACYYGPRRVAEACGAGPDLMARRWWRALAPEADHHGNPAGLRPVPTEQVRSRLRARLLADAEDRAAVMDLAAQQHPDDLDLIMGRKWVSGRRESHAICEALGEHGDPRAQATLVAVLRAMDVDPGHGFAGRRAAGTALGRLGDPGVGRILAQAMVDEALDHEGRPGAGLGIQFPVRTVLITALGEAGCVDLAPLLADYLANTHGSAFGGFYLPAMDALWKLGRTEPLQARLGGPELAAANALGVLGALGAVETLQSRLHDPRPRVAQAARDGLDLWEQGAQGEP